MPDEHLSAAKRDIMARFPGAADEIACIPIPDEAALERVERFAADWAARRKWARQARDAAGGGEAGRVAREREEHRARHEYGVPFCRHTYTPTEEVDDE